MIRFLKHALTILLSLAILGLSARTVLSLVATAPKTERVVETRLPPVVEVIPVARTAMNRVVLGQGEVMPAQEVSISPEVAGRIVEMHPELQPGGVVSAGSLLARIDPEEYKLGVMRARAALAEAEAALEVERGRQLVAEREWELFGKDLPESELGRELALREPQMHQAEARIDSAKSEVSRAELDLKRTEVYAPFDAIVLEESVDLGQHVTPSSNIAMLAGTSAFWVQAFVPAAHLSAILEAARGGTAMVKIYSDLQPGSQPTMTGRLVRHLGQVDSEGRMAQVLIELEDPLALRDDAGHVPLPLNTYVRVELDAGELEDVVAVPREGLRENANVWVMDAEDRLQVRTAEILWRQEDQVAVKDLFEAGDRLIVSPLDQALPGSPLRLRGEMPQEAATEEPEAAQP